VTHWQEGHSSHSYALPAVSFCLEVKCAIRCECINSLAAVAIGGGVTQSLQKHLYQEYAVCVSSAENPRDIVQDVAYCVVP